MTLKKPLFLFIIIPAIIIAAVVGCSDKTFVTSTAEINQQASPTAYLPLNEGLRISYIVLEPENQFFDLEVTAPVTIDGNSGYTIRQTDHINNLVTNRYRYVKGDAIFESQSQYDPGYKILEGPFVVGNSWDRYDTSVPGTNGDGTNDDDDGSHQGKGLTLWGDSFKGKPGDPFGTMTIVAFEDVTALNGTAYGHCLKVAWPIDPVRTNYYWYAGGIGLVKFEQGFNTVDPSEVATVGVMSDFKTVEY